MEIKLRPKEDLAIVLYGLFAGQGENPDLASQTSLELTRALAWMFGAKHKEWDQLLEIARKSGFANAPVITEACYRVIKGINELETANSGS